MSTRKPVEEPRGDISRADAWIVSSWLLVALIGAALVFRAGSLPLSALVIAIAPAAGPLLPSTHLPLARYIATTVAAVNGSLLAFLASLAFGASFNRGVPISEPDGLWLVTVAVAAAVSSVGAGVLVRRMQLQEAHQRWADACVITELVSAAGGSAREAEGDNRSGGRPVLPGALSAAVIFGLLRRRARLTRAR